MVEFRNDDILQVEIFSKKHMRRMSSETAFSSFLKADEIFAKYQYHCTLVVLSEGIEYYPEWVDHIQRNQWRYKIELHGSKHYYYENWSPADAIKDLHEARNKIEETFRCKITTWYVPYGKRHFPVWGEDICNRLGLNFDQINNPFPLYRFHYWHEGQVEKVRQLIEEDVKRA